MLSYSTGELSGLIATRLALWTGICQSDCPFPWTRVCNRTYQLPNADLIPPAPLAELRPFLASHRPGKSPTPCLVFCIRLIYCLLTVFQVAMYFSMHCVKQLSSFFDRLLPGDGMHFWKQ